jgi:hypothetical protein
MPTIKYFVRMYGKTPRIAGVSSTTVQEVTTTPAEDELNTPPEKKHLKGMKSFR